MNGADTFGDAIVDSADALPRAGRRRVVRAVAAVAVALVIALVAGRGLTPMTVRVTPVVRGAAVDAVYASGTVEAVDRVDVKARVAGVVAALPVKEGDRVTRGQLLARLEAPALQIDVDRGQAEVKAARERSRPSLAALVARERMTAAELADARVERDQDEHMARAGGVPTRDLDKARLRVTTLEQQLELARAQLAETEVLRQVDVARSASDFADAQARSRDAEVRAPIAGDVLRSLVDLGRVVQPNEVLLRIGDARHLQIEALVDEDDVVRVQPGRPCVIRVAALGERVLHGHVSRIAPEADREHHSFRIVVALDDGGGDGLRPGMSAEVDVIATRRDHALLVAREAVRDGHAWRLEPDGRLHRRAVKLGVGDLERAEVLDGLADGNRVVAHPDADLADEVRARAEPLPRRVDGSRGLAQRRRAMTTARLIARLALQQLFGRPGLTCIAAVGVALGVITLVTMNAIMKGFQQRFKDQMVDVVEHVFIDEERVDDRPSLLARSAAEPLAFHLAHRPARDRPARLGQPRGLVRALGQLAGVRAACGTLVGDLDASVGSRRFDLSVRGIDPEAQDRCTPLARFVRAGSWRDFVESTDAILIGARLGEEYGLHVGDRIRVRLRDGASQSLRVAAVFETGLYAVDRQLSYVHLTRAQALLGLDVPINHIGVRLADPFAADAVAARLSRLTGHKSVSWIARAAADLAVFNLQNLIVGIQIGAILLVGGFGILAAQIMMVMQKTRDISILRSIGLRRRDIVALFVTQGALIALLGGLFGDLVAWALTSYLASLIDPSQPYSDAALYICKDPPSYAIGLVFAVLVGTLASALPAWRGARVEPVAVLRGSIG